MSQTWQLRYAGKLCSLEQAVAQIAPGQRIFIGSGAAEPAALAEALVTHGSHLCDNEIVHILTLGPAPYVAPEMSRRFRHTAFFIGPNVREAVQSGRADFVPVFLSELPGLLRAGRMKVDVALLQVSPPDERGYVSLGVSVDVVQAAIEAADLLIAQVNPHMPRTFGASALPVSELDYLIDLPTPLPELVAEPPDAVSRAIAGYVASLVPDGATLQTGIGRIPNAVLAALSHRHDLGVHTEMLSDGLMELTQAGVVTGRQKTLLPGRLVTSFVMGSQKLYRWVHENPLVELRPSDFTNDPFVIAQNSRMIAINSALAVDLTGQVAADTVAGRFFSGIGGQVDFIRGAARSRGGKPIIALPSTAQGGKVSRIAAALDAGAGVVTSRGDVHYVVTEYGVAQLWGKSIRERAAALIEIAHPNARAELLDAGKARHYLLPAQSPPNPLPPEPDTVIELPGARRVCIRPVRVSDEDALQHLLYRLSDESAFARFFGQRSVHPRQEVRSMVELDAKTSVALVACLPDGDELIGIARADREALGTAELTITIADDWQGQGIGGSLLDGLAAAARRRGMPSLSADVLPGNARMVRLLRRHGFRCQSPAGTTPLHFELLLDSPATS